MVTKLLFASTSDITNLCPTQAMTVSRGHAEKLLLVAEGGGVGGALTLWRTLNESFSLVQVGNLCRMKYYINEHSFDIYLRFNFDK